MEQLSRRLHQCLSRRG